MENTDMCILHTGIPTKCICRYIPEIMGIVGIQFGISIVHGVYYIQVYQRNVSVGIFQKPWELFRQYISNTIGTVHFSMALFTVFITYGYTDGICLLVYSRNHENCSLLYAVIINDFLTIHFFSNGITDGMKSCW
jgi:hypothetical protein